MNKKSITAIIALMSVALLGSIILQAYWFQRAIRINEDQFDKSVLVALNSTAEQMVRSENDMITKVSDYILQNRKGENMSEEDLFNAGLSIRQIEKLDSLTKTSPIFLSEHNLGETRLFKDARRKEIIENMLYDQLYSYRELEDRINSEKLNEILNENLKSEGLTDAKEQMQFGVYSNQLDKIVIQNGHHAPNVTTAKDPIKAQSYDFLRNTKYRVNLFPSRTAESPGYLAVHFPSRAGYVWESVWLSLIGSIVFTGATLFCFVYTIYTIFRQKKLDTIKNDFINNMTHEFKTPIATISLAADTILSPTIIENPNKVRRFAEMIKQENKRMNGQVEKVLQAAIVDKEKFKLKMEELDLHELILQALDNFSLQIDSRDGELHSNLKAEKTIIKGDMTHISNLIHNLMDNANKYSPEKPNITISTRNIAGGIEFSVTDKGIGLSNNSRKLIFDKFYRVHTGNVHDVKGFGLGLSYVKAMVTAHKGNIDVKSELGKGSTFIVFLPYNESWE